MRILFYVLGVLFLFTEVMVMIYPEEVRVLLYKMNPKSPLTERERELNRKEAIFCILQFLYMAWSAIGLFTINLGPFLGLIVLGIVSSFIRKRVNNKDKALWLQCDAIVSFVIVLFIMINGLFLRMSC